MAKEIKSYKFHDGVFDAWFWLTYGPNDVLASWYKKRGLPADINPHHVAFHEVVDRKQTNGSVFTEYHLHFTYYGYTTIIHETNHAAFRALDDRGLHLTEGTQEVYAYYQQWLAAKVRDRFEYWLHKKRKKA